MEILVFAYLTSERSMLVVSKLHTLLLSWDMLYKETGCRFLSVHALTDIQFKIATIAYTIYLSSYINRCKRSHITTYYTQINLQYSTHLFLLRFSTMSSKTIQDIR